MSNPWFRFARIWYVHLENSFVGKVVFWRLRGRSEKLGRSSVGVDVTVLCVRFPRYEYVLWSSTYVVGASVLWTLSGCLTAYCLLHHPLELDRGHPRNCCAYNHCVLSSRRFAVIDLRVLSQFKLIHSPAITFPWTTLRFVIVLYPPPPSCLFWYKRFPLSVGKTRVLRSGFGSGTFSSPPDSSCLLCLLWFCFIASF
jgi:hypothetical protein